MDMPTPVSVEAKGVFVADRWRAGASGRTIPAAAPAGVDAADAFGAGGGVKESGHGREEGFAAPHGVSALRTTTAKRG